MKRRELREHIFRLLFRVEFNDAADMPEQVALYMEDLPMAASRIAAISKRNMSW